MEETPLEPEPMLEQHEEDNVLTGSPVPAVMGEEEKAETVESDPSLIN